MSGSVEDEHHFLFDCPAYIHILHQYSHLFHQASPSVAAFLATDQPNVVGSYLKTSFAQRQSVSASPLFAWLLNFVELHDCRACGVVVLAPSFITASAISSDRFVLERLGHFVLNVCCLSNYCLLTPLMRPKDKKCKLIDWLLD